MQYEDIPADEWGWKIWIKYSCVAVVRNTQNMGRVYQLRVHISQFPQISRAVPWCLHIWSVFLRDEQLNVYLEIRWLFIQLIQVIVLIELWNGCIHVYPYLDKLWIKGPSWINSCFVLTNNNSKIKMWDFGTITELRTNLILRSTSYISTNDT